MSYAKVSEVTVMRNGLMLSEDRKILKDVVPEELPDDVVIPEGVEEIREVQFYNSRIKSVKFPKSLKTIARGAFKDCIFLERVDFDEDCPLEIINPYIFSACRNLKEVVLPKHVKVIRTQAFAMCSYLGKVVFNEGLLVIEHKAFFGDEVLFDIELPESLNSIGGDAFPYVVNVKINGSLPYNLASALCPMIGADYYYFNSHKIPFRVKITTDNGVVVIPKFVHKDDLSCCEYSLNSGLDAYTHTLYTYGIIGDVSYDTAFSEYLALVKEGKTPHEDLKRYTKRMSKKIAYFLVEKERNDDLIEFIKLNLLSPASLEELYDTVMKKDKTEVAGYLLEAMGKMKKKKSLAL